MLPINNCLNHRRKCAAINPYEMTLIMWHRQKKKRRKNPDQVICGVEVSEGPPEASVLVASSSAPKVCCHCWDVNKSCGTLQGHGRLFACCSSGSEMINFLADRLQVQSPALFLQQTHWIF